MKEDMTKLTQNDRVAELLGIRLAAVDIGYSLAELTIRQDHLNGVGTLHGGIIFSLADYAFAVAVNSGGVPTLAVNANISYFKPPRGPVVRAEAKVISSGRKVCCCEVEIRDDDGTPVAKFSGTGYRKTVPSKGE
ncbi:MAG: PaaI family thioesterase [Clostridiaceae bacterium]|nr:PaaI family thioesterase [Oscillospiraceae bacterium]NLO62388.1 PaaI family thioesterase [Clostridiaceae bacterium]